jgi:hypothetical protein
MAGTVLLCGCQYVLGLHAGTLEDAGISTGGTGATLVSPSENTGGRGAATGGSRSGGPGDDTGGNSAGVGTAAGDTPDLGGSSGVGGTDTSHAGPGGERGGAGGVGGDGRANTGGSSGPAGMDGGFADAGADAGDPPHEVACAAPWRASTVSAHLLAVNSGGTTACGFGGKDLPASVAAVDTANFRGSAACGACLRVRAVTSGASAVVPVVEASGSGGMLLSRAAMDQIAPGADVATVDWTLVACDVGTSPVRYRIKEGTTASYLAIQVRNARYPLSSVSIVTAAGLLPFTLRSDGSWETSGAGTGPVTFRLTDINGQSFDDANVRLVPQSDFVGKGQFPACH